MRPVKKTTIVAGEHCADGAVEASDAQDGSVGNVAKPGDDGR
jgi:hypothetical protein